MLGTIDPTRELLSYSKWSESTISLSPLPLNIRSLHSKHEPDIIAELEFRISKQTSMTPFSVHLNTSKRTSGLQSLDQCKRSHHVVITSVDRQFPTFCGRAYKPNEAARKNGDPQNKTLMPVNSMNKLAQDDWSSTNLMLIHDGISWLAFESCLILVIGSAYESLDNRLASKWEGIIMGDYPRAYRQREKGRRMSASTNTRRGKWYFPRRDAV